MNENHYHNGVDSPKINPKDLEPFPILESVPTFKSQEGVPFFVKTGGNYFLYVKLDGNWVSTQLT